MTKTVKLTPKYINFIKSIPNRTGKKYPTISGEMFCYVDRTNLSVEGKAVRNEDIATDHENIPIYNLKLDPAGRKTIDLTSVHSTVSAECYDLVDANDTIQMPIAIADSLIQAGTLEEVS